MTAVANLKPLTTGQLLDRAFRLYRHRFSSFVGIIALPQIPLAIISIFVSIWTANIDPSLFANPTSEMVATGISLFLIGFSFVVLTLLAMLIGIAALSQALADHYSGRTIGITQAYGKIGRSWLSLLAVFFLSLLLMIFLFLFFLIPCIGWIIAIPGTGFITFLYLVIAPLSVSVITLVLQRDFGIIRIRRATLTMRKISSKMASLIIIDNFNGFMSSQLWLL